MTTRYERKRTSLEELIETLYTGKECEIDLSSLKRMLSFNFSTLIHNLNHLNKMEMSKAKHVEAGKIVTQDFLDEIYKEIEKEIRKCKRIYYIKIDPR